MKKKTTLLIVIAAIVLASVFTLLLFNRDTDLSSKKKGEFMKSSTSPNGTYTVSFYLYNGGATTSYGVLGVLTENSSGTEKNIYYQYHTNSSRNNWVDDNTITINDIRLDVRSDTYENHEYQGGVSDLDYYENNIDDSGFFQYWISVIKMLMKDFGGLL